MGYTTIIGRSDRDSPPCRKEIRVITRELHGDASKQFFQSKHGHIDVKAHYMYTFPTPSGGTLWWAIVRKRCPLLIEVME